MRVGGRTMHALAPFENTQKAPVRNRMSKSPPSSIKMATNRAFSRGFFNNSKHESEVFSPTLISNNSELHQKHSTNPKRQMPAKLLKQPSLRSMMHATDHFKKSPRVSQKEQYIQEDPNEEYYTAVTV